MARWQARWVLALAATVLATGTVPQIGDAVRGDVRVDISTPEAMGTV